MSEPSRPLSPRRLLQDESLALSEAMTTAFSFATSSAASFAAATNSTSVYEDVPAVRARYNLRSSVSRLPEKENCDPAPSARTTLGTKRGSSHATHASRKQASHLARVSVPVAAAESLARTKKCTVIETEETS